jgi:hypothetical protein
VGALFHRQFALSVGGIGIATSSTDPARIHSTLRVAFRVDRTSQKEPSPAEITIWNLSKDSRAALESARLPVELSVGYSGQIFRIFSGDLLDASTQRQGVDLVTKLQLQDGAGRYRSARVNESLAPGTPLSAAIQAAATALGLPLGNLAAHLTNVRGTTQALQKGFALVGSAQEQLTKLLKLAGYGWSIQDGQLQVLAPGEPAPGETVVLNADSGLVGSPERGQDGTVKARSLIVPGIAPGRLVIIDRAEEAITLKVERALHVGDSWASDWYTEIEGQPTT